MSETAPAAASGAESAPQPKPKAADRNQRRGLFARIALFVRQVVAELKKVVYPTRPDLITYTTVVLVFVAVVCFTPSENNTTISVWLQTFLPAARTVGNSLSPSTVKVAVSLVLVGPPLTQVKAR